MSEENYMHIYYNKHTKYQYYFSLYKPPNQFIYEDKDQLLDLTGEVCLVCYGESKTLKRCCFIGSDTIAQPKASDSQVLYTLYPPQHAHS